MQPSEYIISPSRGPLIDEKALLEPLNAGRSSGAALDVLEPELLPLDSPWRTTPWG
jgi:glycerate dehydrogenase